MAGAKSRRARSIPAVSAACSASPAVTVISSGGRRGAAKPSAGLWGRRSGMFIDRLTWRIHEELLCWLASSIPALPLISTRRALGCSPTPILARKGAGRSRCCWRVVRRLGRRREVARRKGANSKPRGPLPAKTSVARVRIGREKYGPTREGEHIEDLAKVRRLEGGQMVSESVGSVERAISMLEANNFRVGAEEAARIVGCSLTELQRALEARGYRWLSEEGKLVRVPQQSNEVGSRGLSY